MALNKKAHHWHSEMFDDNFRFCIGWTWKEFESWLWQNYKMKSEMNNPQGCHMAFHYKGKNISIIYTRFKHGMEFRNTVVHESIHAAFYALHWSGVKVTHDNHEPLAYFSGLIYQKIMESLKSGS